MAEQTEPRTCDDWTIEALEEAARRNAGVAPDFGARYLRLIEHRERRDHDALIARHTRIITRLIIVVTLATVLNLILLACSLIWSIMAA